VDIADAMDIIVETGAHLDPIFDPVRLKRLDALAGLIVTDAQRFHAASFAGETTPFYHDH
jgi:hypothetical protein